MVPILEARDIRQYFGGVHAVDGLSLAVERGEIFGIIGPNGSGKSTFFNSLTGIYRPTGGRFYFQGKDVTGLEPHVLVKHGISRTFQNLRTFGSMSVIENVITGQHICQSTNVFDALVKSRRYRADEARSRTKAEELLELVGLSHMADHNSSGLSYGQQKRLELARALSRDALLLLLDEPTAGIPFADAHELMELIRRVRDMQGTTIMIIEHNMRVMSSLADRIVAMDRGQSVSEGAPQKVLSDPVVIEAYLGEEQDAAQDA